MGLNDNDRVTIEKTIDHAIQEIPKLIQTFRNQETKKHYQITTPDEFTYGFIHGKIITMFSAQFVVTHNRELNDHEFAELAQILQRRSRELKDAIFNCG